MRVLVDTPIWSLSLRRRRDGVREQPLVAELRQLIDEARVALIGPVRQEILSGVQHRQQFDQLKARLRAFPDMAIELADYETAAEFCNACRTRGIQGSQVDFLICAAASRRDYAIFTTDDDFARYAKVVPVKLHRSR